MLKEPSESKKRLSICRSQGLSISVNGVPARLAAGKARRIMEKRHNPDLSMEIGEKDGVKGEKGMADIKIDRVIRTKRKSIALILTDEGKLIVRSPVNTSNKYIEKVVNEKRNWIIKKQEMIKRRSNSYEPKKYVNGEKFLILGESYGLKIVSAPVKDITIDGKQILLPEGYLSKADKNMLAWYKKQAKEFICRRVKRFSGLLGIKYNTVKISNAKKRWGSCSSKGNLNFSWRLYMAPAAVIDYVVVHELIHVEIPNHSKQYWSRVRALMPDYEKHRHWLYENQKKMSIE